MLEHVKKRNNTAEGDKFPLQGLALSTYK